MSAFWDNMTKPRPINRAIVSHDETKKRYEDRINALEYQLKNLKAENQRLRNTVYEYKKDAMAALNTPKSLQDILESVAAFCDLEPNDLKARTRVESYRRARCIFYLKARRYGYSLKEVGKYVNRDHSTVINALQKTDALLDDFDIQFTQL